MCPRLGTWPSSQSCAELNRRPFGSQVGTQSRVTPTRAESAYLCVCVLNNLSYAFKNVNNVSLARWLCWLEHCPLLQKVADSIPGQDRYLGCRFYPWSECIWQATDQCFSLISMFLSLSLSLESINVYF